MAWLRGALRSEPSGLVIRVDVVARDECENREGASSCSEDEGEDDAEEMDDPDGVRAGGSSRSSFCEGRGR